MMRKRSDRRKNRKDEKGIVGIGTLIVFIAMVLVAAIAAAVIINTAARLQQRAESATADTVNDLGIGLMVVNTVAHIGKLPSGASAIDNIFIYVELNPGAESLNLTNVMVVFQDKGTGSDIVANLKFSDSSQIVGSPDATHYYVYDEGKSVADLGGVNLGGIDPNNGYEVDLGAKINHPMIDQDSLLVIRIAGGATGLNFWMPPGSYASIKLLPSGGGSIGLKEFRVPGSFDSFSWITIA